MTFKISEKYVRLWLSSAMVLTQQQKKKKACEAEK